MGAAFMRGYHARYDSSRIFDDPLAYSLLTEEERSIITRHWLTRLHAIDPSAAAACPDETSALERALKRWTAAPTVLSRARYAEDGLATAVAQGARQYVILGAGLDTFAFRRKDLLERLRVFEVDRPSTQTFKLRRIARLGWEIPARLHFVSLDFTAEKLDKLLRFPSYDPCALTFFSWLGVTYYLSSENIFSTLRSLAEISAPGSAIIFDYFTPCKPDGGGKAARCIKSILDSMEKVGEPLKAGLDPLALHSDLENVGLHLQENLSPSDIQQRYFTGRSDGYRASEHIRFALAVVK